MSESEASCTALPVYGNLSEGGCWTRMAHDSMAEPKDLKKNIILNFQYAADDMFGSLLEHARWDI